MAEQIDDHDEIVRVLELCMEGEAKGDAGRLKEAFHEDARMFGEVAGTRYDMPIAEFVDVAVSEPADTGSGVVGASGWRRRQRGGRRGRLLGQPVVHRLLHVEPHRGRLEDRQQDVRTHWRRTARILMSVVRVRGDVYLSSASSSSATASSSARRGIAHSPFEPPEWRAQWVELMEEQGPRES